MTTPFTRTLAGLALIATIGTVGAACGSSSSSSTPTTDGSSTTCQPIDDAGVVGLFDKWNADVVSGDPDKVVADYASDAVLLPTLSDQPRLTQDARRAYFVDFLAKGPSGKITSQTIAIGCNMATNSGLYTFTFADGSTADARFTYVYEYVDGQWLIEAHHSSMQPDTGH